MIIILFPQPLAIPARSLRLFPPPFSRASRLSLSACLSCSRVPQYPLSLGKASGGGTSLLTFHVFSFILTSNWLSACGVVKLDSPMVSFFVFSVNFDQLAKMYWYISDERLNISKAVKSKGQELAPESGEILIYNVCMTGGKPVQNMHVRNPPWKDRKPLNHLF